MAVKTLDRYLLSELITPFFIGIAGFVVILTTDLLFAFVDLIINRGIPAGAVFQLVLYKLPAIMVLTYPVSFLFAASSLFNRLSRDGEFAVMRTSGIDFVRICLPIIIAALFVCGIAFATNEVVVPWANKISEKIIKEIIYKQPLPDIKEQIFFKDNFNRYYYVRKYYPKTNMLEGIMIYEINESNFPRVITAKTAQLFGSEWVLTEGIMHSYDAEGHINYEANFSKMKIIVNENIINFSQQKTPEEMNSMELKTMISFLGKGGVNTKYLSTEFFMKFSIPAASLVFAIIGIPLSIFSLRSGKATGLVLSVIIMMSFYVFGSVFRSLGRGGFIPPFWAAWFPSILVSSIGAFLILKEELR